MVPKISSSDLKITKLFYELTVEISAEGATPEAFDENADHASCFIYVASGDHPWPTRDTLLPILQQFGYPDPGDAFLGRLAATQHRAQLIGKWTSKKDEVVHIYSLRSPRSPSFP